MKAWGRRQSCAISAVLLLLLVIAGSMVAVFAWPQPPRAAVTGTVTDTDGPVSGALVRVQTTDNHTYTGDDGTFTLEGLNSAQSVTLVAWADGYLFGWTDVRGGDVDVAIVLTPHNRLDHAIYDWQPSAACGECHLSYAEWQQDAHSQAALNMRFLTMYNGSDMQGNRSRNSNYDSGLPRTRDPERPYFGPGFKVDFPKRDGNCAACHTPMASKLEADNSCGWNGCHMQETIAASDELSGSVSPNAAIGVAAEGISCDFCHKIGDVILEADTGLPDPEMPGILSLTLYRPQPGQEFLMGTVDDVARAMDSFNPLHRESAFCAACHYGVNDTTIIYNSYGEWLDSPYSDPQSGATCQECHMPVAPRVTSRMDVLVQALAWLERDSGRALPAALGTLAQQADRSYFVYPQMDGLYRELDQIHLHQMPGATHEAFLRSAIDLDVSVETVGSDVVVDVQITNTGAGHHFPTGSPLRHLLLIVRATAADGRPLPLLDGSVLPDWAGDVAGEAGQGFAKILRDTLTDEEPTFAHWRMVMITQDTRIPALTTHSSSYVFEGSGDSQVAVQLIYRRAFQQLQEWKGWTDPDILLATENIKIE